MRVRVLMRKIVREGNEDKIHVRLAEDPAPSKVSCCHLEKSSAFDGGEPHTLYTQSVACTVVRGIFLCHLLELEFSFERDGEKRWCGRTLR